MQESSRLAAGLAIGRKSKMSANIAQASQESDLALLNQDMVIYIDKANQVSTQVPRGWKRKLDHNRIVYISPNQQVISSMEQLTSYLLTAGTCKCNLSCPFFPEELFNFDPLVESEEFRGYDETMKVNCKHAQRSATDSLNDASRFIVQSPVNSLRTGSQPVTIQSLLNCKPPNGEESGQIYGYIPINISKGLSMGQPIILSSPIKSTNITNSPQVLQILSPTASSPMLQSAMLSMQPANQLGSNHVLNQTNST